MNFLDKAKKKQAELKAQLEKASKDISNFKIGDSFSSTSKASKPPEDADAITSPAELDSKSVSQPVAELDSAQSTSTTSTAPVLTPATSKAGGSFEQQSAATAVSPQSFPGSAAAAVSLPPRNPAKLSLAQRKDARDDWEQGAKPRLEKQLSDLLGVQWTLDADAATILNVKGDGVAANIELPGAMIKDYMQSGVKRIRETVEWYKDAAAEINALAYQHILSLEIDTELTGEVPSDKVNRADFRDGRLRLLIHRDHLYSATGAPLNRLVRLILDSRSGNEKLKNEVDFVAKRGIHEDWDKEVTRILEQAREQLDNEGFQFDPRFREVWQRLNTYANTKVGKKKTSDMLWPENIGGNIWSFFNTFVVKLKDQKFDEDEMLQEAFKEAVPKHVAAFRLVDETKQRHETVIEDGILYLQAKPEDFWSGPGSVAEHLMDLL